MLSSLKTITSSTFALHSAPDLVELPIPILLEGFDSTTGFVANSGSPTQAINSSRHVQGAGGLSLRATTTTAVQTTKSNAGVHNPSDFGVVAYYVDFDNENAFQDLTSFGVNIGQSGTYYSTSGITNFTGLTEATFGGFWRAFNVSEVTGLKDLTSATTGVRVVTGHAAPYGQTPVVDCLMYHAAGEPEVLITFDDIRPGQVSNALPILDAVGAKASWYVPTSLVGAASRLTLSQLASLEAAGHDLAINGTNDDTAITTRASTAEWIAELQAQQAWFAANGLIGRAKRHTNWPNGTRLSAGTEVQKTGVTTNGTAVLTMADTTGLVVGMQITGNPASVQTQTFIQSVDSGTQITATKTIAAGVTAIKGTVVSGVWQTGKSAQALRDAGTFDTARGVNNGVNYKRFGYGYGRAFNLASNGASNPADATALLAQADLAVLRGSTVQYHFHDVTASPTGQDIHTDVFQALITGLVSRGLRFKTLSQSWNDIEALPF